MRRRWRRGTKPILLLMLLLALGWPRAYADDIEDVAAKPPAEALPQLEALLKAEGEDGDAERTTRIHVHLARLRLAQGEPYAALSHLEALMRGRNGAVDHVSYAEALVAVARGNLDSRSTAAGVVPYLQDALAALDSIPAKEEVPASLAARQVLARGEALFLLRRYDEAAALLAKAPAERFDGTANARLNDLYARTLYAAGRYADSAAAFERTKNMLGAAAAYDAARLPEKSAPIYAAALRAAPGDTGILDRAMRGARYTGGEAVLLGALEGIEALPGASGIPLLLARAEMLEAAGRTQEALAPLREAGKRTQTDPRPPAQLARLLLLTGDSEDESVWDAAAAAYMTALERDPESDAAANGLYFIAGRDYRLLWKRWRDPQIAGRCLRVQEALVKARPDDALSLANLGNTERVLGHDEAALAAYERARKSNPYDPSVRSDQGLALSAAGRPAEALAAYEDSLVLDAGHLAGRQNAARALWLEGHDDEAEAHLDAAVRTARAVGRSPATYRYLLDRIWRTRQDPSLR